MNATTIISSATANLTTVASATASAAASAATAASAFVPLPARHIGTFMGVPVEAASNVSDKNALWAVQHFGPLAKFMASKKSAPTVFDLRRITLLAVNPFGPSDGPKPTSVGFVYFSADLHQMNKTADGSFKFVSVPTLVFARPDAVSVLPVVSYRAPDADTEELYVVLACQLRAPYVELALGADAASSGEFNPRDFHSVREAFERHGITETVAGMIESSSGNLVGGPGTATRELAEETGIVLNESDLVLLGDAYPSPGATLEKIAMYTVKNPIPLSDEQALKMLGSAHGLVDENESVLTRMVKLDSNFVRSTKDLKIAATFGLMYAAWQDGHIDWADALFNRKRKQSD